MSGRAERVAGTSPITQHTCVPSHSRSSRWQLAQFNNLKRTAASPPTAWSYGCRGRELHQTFLKSAFHQARFSQGHFDLMSISLFMPVLYLAPSEKQENRFLKMLPTLQTNASQHHKGWGWEAGNTGRCLEGRPGIHARFSACQADAGVGREAGEKNKTGEREGVGGTGFWPRSSHLAERAWVPCLQVSGGACFGRLCLAH